MAEHNLVAHLVGSVPLADADTVFRTLGPKLGAHLAMLPDGETGERIGWIRFLQELLNNHPDMEIDADTPPLQWRQWDGVLLREIPMLKFRDGVDVRTVTFDTGYAAAAIASFATFDKLQGDDVIPRHVKFQICVPTPLAPAYNYISPRAQDDFIAEYTDHIVGEISSIAGALPHDRIAVQWDVCQEVLMWENYYPYPRPGHEAEILSVLGKIGDAVPEPIGLGYHLCYGSPRDEHLVQPKDTANMVAMTKGILATVNRTVNFVHLPVPKNRTDDAYFVPLQKLDLAPSTALYLGLVHYKDEAGDQQRLQQARKYVRVNGVGSECGWGRTDPGRIPSMIESHAKAVSS